MGTKSAGGTPLVRFCLSQGTSLNIVAPKRREAVLAAEAADRRAADKAASKEKKVGSATAGKAPGVGPPGVGVEPPAKRLKAA